MPMSQFRIEIRDKEQCRMGSRAPLSFSLPLCLSKTKNFSSFFFLFRLNLPLNKIQVKDFPNPCQTTEKLSLNISALMGLNVQHRKEHLNTDTKVLV